MSTVDPAEQALGSRYVLAETIGRGASGRVRRGRVRESGEDIAVKTLHPSLTARPEIVTRFVRERRVLTRIAHPNVVKVRDLVVEGDTLAIVLDYVPGGDLRAMLDRAGTLVPSQALEVARQVLAGMSALHGGGVVHRDIKPENVLIDDTDPSTLRFLVSDAGIAWITHGIDSDEGAAVVVGSPEYLAPEVLSGGQPTPSADLYATGILLYELLFGRTPFAGGHVAAVLYRQRAAAPERPPGVPEGLWTAVGGLLAKDPAGRPPSATDAVETLDAIEVEVRGLPAFPPVPASDFVPTPPLPDARTTQVRGRNAPVPGQPSGSAEAPPAPARFSKGWLLAGSAGLLVVLLAGWALAGRDDVGRTASSPVVYASAPARVDGLAVSRTLSLSGEKGTSVDVRARITNEMPTPVDTVYEEVVPKSLAASVDQIRFRPAIDTVVERDPVVQYRIQLDPGETFSFRYETTVPGKGLNEARLAAWADDQDAALDARRAAAGATPPTRLLSLDVNPRAVTLPLREAFRLEITGVMSDQSPASQALLAGATVRSSQPSVVEARGVTVIAARNGKATITVQAGRLRRSVPATVGATAPSSVPSSVGGGGTGVPGAPCTPASTLQTWSLLSDEVYADQSRSAPLDRAALAPGQKAWVVIEVRNTGDTPWCREGANPVMLGTEAPRDRSSAIAAAGWFSPIRPALLREATVPPGGAGTFEFPVVAPPSPGPFSERFNLLAAELAWFDDIGYSLDGVVVG